MYNLFWPLAIVFRKLGFVGGIYAGVYMHLSVCLFVSGMYVELDLVATARLCRVSHEMRITTEDGD